MLHNNNPIELTTNLLEKCGFQLVDGYLQINVNIGDLYFKEGCIVFQAQVWHEYSESPMEHIKYLHQLQNLYYLLTNEELTIKP